MKKIVLFFLSVVLLASCEGGIAKMGEGVKKVFDIKLSATGAPFEVMLVCDDNIWNSSAGQALEQALDTPVPGLPQPEASFKVTRRSKSGFNSTAQAYRNIIIVDIDSSHSECKFKSEMNVYADKQVVMGICAPDKKSFGEFVYKNANVIVKYFTEKERERQIAILEGSHNKKILAIIKQMFGCEMLTPSELTGRKVGKDFIWISDYNNPSKTDIMNFAVYSYPYTSADNFSKDNFIKQRDAFMKENIPGGVPDSYIQTDAKTVSVSAVSYNGKYMTIARGLWYMKNDDMFGGGPFVSHSIVDEKNGRVIVVEAFVSAPNKEKRGYMRKLEASLYTLKLPVDLEEENIAKESK